MINQMLYDISIILIPAMLANAIPIVFSQRKLRNTPIHIRLFGPHKTRRGGILAILAGAVSLQGMVRGGYTDLGYLQQMFHIHQIYQYVSISLIGAYLGLWVIIGDMIESSIKRSISIPAGRPRLPRDKIDYIIGIMIGTRVRYDWSITSIILIMIIGGGMSTRARLLGYSMGLTKEKR